MEASVFLKAASGVAHEVSSKRLTGMTGFAAFTLLAVFNGRLELGASDTLILGGLTIAAGLLGSTLLEGKAKGQPMIVAESLAQLDTPPAPVSPSNPPGYTSSSTHPAP